MHATLFINPSEIPWGFGAGSLPADESVTLRQLTVMAWRQTLLNHRWVLDCQKPSAPGWLANSTPILFHFPCGIDCPLSSLESQERSKFPSVMWSGRKGEVAAPEGREGVAMWEKLRALFSRTRTQKAPLFPTTWAHQPRYVGIRGLPRQPEDPGASEKGAPVRPVPDARAGWQLREAAGNFPATQQAPRCPSHRCEHNGHVARGASWAPS